MTVLAPAGIAPYDLATRFFRLTFYVPSLGVTSTYAALSAPLAVSRPGDPGVLIVEPVTGYAVGQRGTGVGPMLKPVPHVLGVCAVGQIAQAAVSGVAVEVTHFHALRPGADESLGNEGVDGPGGLAVVAPEADDRVTVLMLSVLEDALR
jgi:hypothetical protein